MADPSLFRMVTLCQGSKPQGREHLILRRLLHCKCVLQLRFYGYILSLFVFINSYFINYTFIIFIFVFKLTSMLQFSYERRSTLITMVVLYGLYSFLCKACYKSSLTHSQIEICSHFPWSVYSNSIFRSKSFRKFFYV